MIRKRNLRHCCCRALDYASLQMHFALHSILTDNPRRSDQLGVMHDIGTKKNPSRTPLRMPLLGKDDIRPFENSASLKLDIAFHSFASKIMQFVHFTFEGFFGWSCVPHQCIAMCLDNCEFNFRQWVTVMPQQKDVQQSEDDTGCDEPTLASLEQLAHQILRPMQIDLLGDVSDLSNKLGPYSSFFTANQQHCQAPSQQTTSDVVQNHSSQKCPNKEAAKNNLQKIKGVIPFGLCGVQTETAESIRSSQNILSPGEEVSELRKQKGIGFVGDSRHQSMKADRGKGPFANKSGFENKNNFLVQKSKKEIISEKNLKATTSGKETTTRLGKGQHRDGGIQGQIEKGKSLCHSLSEDNFIQAGPEDVDESSRSIERERTKGTMCTYPVSGPVPAVAVKNKEVKRKTDIGSEKIGQSSMSAKETTVKEIHRDGVKDGRKEQTGSIGFVTLKDKGFNVKKDVTVAKTGKMATVGKDTGKSITKGIDRGGVKDGMERQAGAMVKTVDKDTGKSITKGIDRGGVKDGMERQTGAMVSAPLKGKQVKENKNTSIEKIGKATSGKNTGKSVAKRIDTGGIKTGMKNQTGAVAGIVLKERGFNVKKDVSIEKIGQMAPLGKEKSKLPVKEAHGHGGKDGMKENIGKNKDLSLTCNEDSFIEEQSQHMESEPSRTVQKERNRVTKRPHLVSAPVAPTKEEWVNCVGCGERRLLPPSIRLSSLPELWFCRMNDWLPGMNKCGISEGETSKATRALSITQEDDVQVHRDRRQPHPLAASVSKPLPHNKAVHKRVPGKDDTSCSFPRQKQPNSGTKIDVPAQNLKRKPESEEEPRPPGKRIKPKDGQGKVFIWHTMPRKYKFSVFLFNELETSSVRCCPGYRSEAEEPTADTQVAGPITKQRWAQEAFASQEAKSLRCSGV
eukprot:Gb_13124 [translate_table: standard]